MKAIELLQKLERLDEIPSKGWNIRGRPCAIRTVSIDGELLVSRWRKRCQQYKINLINQFKKEASINVIKYCKQYPQLMLNNPPEITLRDMNS